jgi:hypothetical protein
MYTVKIDISDWCSDEFVTIETSDFDKVQIIQEFVEFQKENGWAADYEQIVEFSDEDEEEAEEEEEEELVEEDEPVTVSTYVITRIEE